jgi:glycosyltransferase involved in cell wall biosynthesis
MKIGLFTDAYHPQSNGIVYVVDFTREYLEKLGYEVYIYCPKERLISLPKRDWVDSHIISLPSIAAAGPDTVRTSLFNPGAVFRKIKKQQLDAMVFFTPSTLGLMATYAAKKTDAVLIAQHSTDLHEALKYYPRQIKPGLFLMTFVAPLAAKMNRKKMRQALRLFLPNFINDEVWSLRALNTLMSLVYSSCDAVIAVSRKSQKQISGMTRGTGTDIRVIPTGVDPLPKASARTIAKFRKSFGLSSSDEVIIYFGRLGEEKDLKFLFPMLERVVKKRPRAKLLLCGDNEYRPELEEIARQSPVADKIIFGGRYQRSDIPALAALAKVYVFPSTFDTQGLTLHEAALCGLPIVLIDRGLSEVVNFGENGFIVRKSYGDFAWRVLQILENPEMQKRFSKKSVELAKQFTQIGQTKLMADLIEEKLSLRAKRSNPDKFSTGLLRRRKPPRNYKAN